MTFVIHANLDCESTWNHIPLPPAIQHRVSLYGLLASAFAPDDAEIELWTPAAIDPARWLGTAKAQFRVGVPPRADFAWADPRAAAANDRRLVHAIAALPGSWIVGCDDDLERDWIAGPWIAKPVWAAAGRDRCRGNGPPAREHRTRLHRLLARCGALVVEPWCDRLLDVGLCAAIDDRGAITANPPHGLISDPRGGFVGIDLAGAALLPSERAELEAALAAAGAAIARTGFTGRFAIDAFAYRDHGGTRRFHPLCEINARTTFGWVAWAFAARCGTSRLGFSPAPAGATVLVAPAHDHITAWIA